MSKKPVTIKDVLNLDDDKEILNRLIEVGFPSAKSVVVIMLFDDGTLKIERKAASVYESLGLVEKALNVILNL